MVVPFMAVPVVFKGPNYLWQPRGLNRFHFLLQRQESSAIPPFMAAQGSSSDSSFYCSPVVFMGSTFYGSPVLFMDSSFYGTPDVFMGPNFYGSPVVFMDSTFYGSPGVFMGSTFYCRPVFFMGSTFYCRPAQGSSSIPPFYGSPGFFYGFHFLLQSRWSSSGSQFLWDSRSRGLHRIPLFIAVLESSAIPPFYGSPSGLHRGSQFLLAVQWFFIDSTFYGSAGVFIEFHFLW